LQKIPAATTMSIAATRNIIIFTTHRAIPLLHLVELINATNAPICQNQRTALQDQFLRHHQPWHQGKKTAFRILGFVRVLIVCFSTTTYICEFVSHDSSGQTNTAGACNHRFSTAVFLAENPARTSAFLPLPEV
jgi:hypothetical protein